MVSNVTDADISETVNEPYTEKYVVGNRIAVQTDSKQLNKTKWPSTLYPGTIHSCM